MNAHPPPTRTSLRAPSQPGARLSSSPERVPAALLFQGQRTVEIEHNGEIYRLSLTRSEKLILTK